MDKKKIEQAVRLLLEGMGEDPDREGLMDTPKRVAGYWEELLEGNRYTNLEIAQMYGKVFNVESPTPIVKEMDNVFSHCEHHLALMYNMKVTVAYIPAKWEDGHYKVLGLSKIPRIVDMCAKRLQLQEKLTNDIAECIQIATKSQDIYVKVTADHACVSARGIKSPGKTVTEYTSGKWRPDGEDL